MIVIDIAVKRFGGLSNKLGDITGIVFTLALEAARWSYLRTKGGFAGMDLNILRRNGCSMNYWELIECLKIRKKNYEGDKDMDGRFGHRNR